MTAARVELATIAAALCDPQRTLDSLIGEMWGNKRYGTEAELVQM